MPSVEERFSKRLNVTRFFVRVRDPRTGTFTSRTFATRPEAEQFQGDVENRGARWALEALDRDEAEADEATLDDWAQRHFDAMTKASDQTIARYRNIYRARWAPSLGALPLSQIGREEVARALKAQRGSDKTILNAWGVLRQMMDRAARDNLIPTAPTDDVEPGRRTSHEEREHRFLTREEFWRIVQATPDHWQPLIMMLGGTGMRWSEAAALNVGDINVEQRTVRITKAERPDAVNPRLRVVGPTKTKQSKRTVELPRDTLDALLPLLDRPRGERLFLPPKGGVLRHRTFYVNIWQGKSLPGAHLDDPQPRLHDLRHSQVAWLIEANVPLPVIQRRLGHSTIATTNDVYGHLLPDVRRAAADAADMVFRRPPELS